MRRNRVLLAGAAALCAVFAGPTAAYAESVVCDSPVTIESISNFNGSVKGQVTVSRFDFVGTVEHCLPDRERVPGVLVGSALQVVHADGSGTIVVRETLTIPSGSTLDFVVRARFSPSEFDGKVLATGGTGELSRVHGHGTFYPTGPPTGPAGPTSFFSSITYEYH